MKQKMNIWYVGYVVAVLLIVFMYATDFTEMVDAALGICFAVVFSVTHVQVLHKKMLATDDEYRVEVMDERHIAIKEKAGMVGNMVNILLMGCATVIFIIMDFIVPAVILGIIVCIQPIILIIISNMIEKKM